MAIRQKPLVPRQAPAVREDKNFGDEFIAGAPDSAKPKANRKSKKVKREQISLTFVPEILGEVDKVAHKKGLSRAMCVQLMIQEALDSGMW